MNSTTGSSTRKGVETSAKKAATSFATEWQLCVTLTVTDSMYVAISDVRSARLSGSHEKRRVAPKNSRTYGMCL